MFPTVYEFCYFGYLHFQQDGALSHQAKNVRQSLDKKFPNRWIGRREPIKWTARSPDLIPPDFFPRGVLKNPVYANKPKTIDQLKQSIQHK